MLEDFVHELLCYLLICFIVTCLLLIFLCKIIHSYQVFQGRKCINGLYRPQVQICSCIKLCYPKQGCRAPYSGF